MADPGDLRPRREAPLVAGSAVAGRALVTVIAIMTFLASLSAGAAALIEGAARGWEGAVAREVTVQLRPAAGRDADADEARAAAVLRAAPGIEAVEPFDAAAAAKLLEPWLGASPDLADLPMPRLIAARLSPAGGFDADGLRAALAAAVPGASLDDHRAWRGRLAAAAGALVTVAAAVCALVIAALALAVSFATRGAMAGSREVIGVLHFVGAEDRFIAREFARRFRGLGLRGAALGGGLACAAFALAQLAGGRLAGDAGGEVEALFGTFALGPLGYAAIALVALGAGLATGWTSRAVVFRHLRDLD